LKGLHFLSPIFVDFWSEIIYVSFIVNFSSKRKMLKYTPTLPSSARGGGKGGGAKELEGTDGEGGTEEGDLLGRSH
jgi:hypothetical protein